MSKEHLPWYYNDEFWRVLVPKFNSETHWKQATDEIDQIINLLDISSADSILDLGCGPGRHSFELLKKGMNVSSLDRTKFYLDFLEKKARENKLSANTVLADMKSYVDEEKFDVILNLNSSFGYFEELSDHMLVLENVYKSLKKGGAALFELYGKEIISRSFTEREWSEHEGTYFLDDRSVDQDWNRIINKCKVISDGKVTEATFSLSVYSAKEFSEMLSGVGFRRITHYGSLKGIPYDQHAQKLVSVGLK